MVSDTERPDARQLYFISDLHIGGDEQLQVVDFEEELLAFLRDLETGDEDAELIVNGDAFGLWEFTELEGVEKFDALVERYPDLFDQLRATGERIPITFIPGNHDYELACYPEYIDRLAEYNVTLEQEVVITRPVGDRVVWIEHGQQRDANNQSPDFGNLYANPPGYFVNRNITSRAGKLSARGKFNWLRDIQSVTPMDEIPGWMISNYFYREMSPLLRYTVLPFLLLFNVSLLYLIVIILYVSNVWQGPLDATEWALGQIGVVGGLIDFILVVNLVIIVLLVLIAIPVFFFARDVRKTLYRFGFVPSEEPEVVANAYVEGAQEVFAEHPEVAVFVYGHTHRASLTEIDDRVVINTGTWLKRLTRQSVMLGLLPWVFYPSFLLNYFRITEENGIVVVEYRIVDKPDPKDLTLLERLLTRDPRLGEPIPDRFVVDAEWRSSGPPAEEGTVQPPSTPDGIDD